MEVIFELNQVPVCPACGKPLEGGNFVAREFVSCNRLNYPIGNPAVIECDCCQKTIVIRPSADKQTITFSVK